MAKLYIKDGQILSAKQIVIKADGYQIINPTEEILLENGWEEYVAPEQTQTEEEIAEMAARQKQDEIDRLKERLAESDYKVIKCMEASLCGAMLPYDVYGLRDERNELREQINRLENETEEKIETDKDIEI